MRVTQGLNQAQFLATLTQLESNLSQTHNQISTNLAFTTPSQNPVAAGTVNNYEQALAQSQQYDSNASSAQTRLSTEDTALAQVQTALQSLRNLALQARLLKMGAVKVFHKPVAFDVLLTEISKHIGLREQV